MKKYEHSNVSMKLKKREWFNIGKIPMTCYFKARFIIYATTFETFSPRAETFILYDVIFDTSCNVVSFHLCTVTLIALIIYGNYKSVQFVQYHWVVSTTAGLNQLIMPPWRHPVYCGRNRLSTITIWHLETVSFHSVAMMRWIKRCLGSNIGYWSCVISSSYTIVKPSIVPCYTNKVYGKIFQYLDHVVIVLSRYIRIRT